MENIDCPLCAKKNSTVVIQENGFNGVKCSECGLIYISPRPSFSELLEYYDDDYADSHIAFKKSKTRHAKLTLSIIKKFVSKGKILELGAGGGHFLLEAERQGFDVFGIEPNPIEAKLINDELSIPCENNPLNKDSFPGVSFDAIYHCNVLSHFYDPIQQFLLCREKIVDNGFMIFETGNIGDIDSKYYKRFSSFEYPTHLFFFGEKSLKKIMNKTGFKIVKVYRYSLKLLLAFEFWFWKLKSIKKKQSHISYKFTGSYKGLSRNKFNYIVRNIYRNIKYFLTYKIKIKGNKNKPHTIIIIAQKL
jgi:2-polyprenyl-3-methyl-5-hydroxy-6-metoxy-1,4-benzoquinol methylase